MIKIIKFTEKKHKTLINSTLLFYQQKNVYKYFIFSTAKKHIKTSKQATNSKFYH